MSDIERLEDMARKASRAPARLTDAEERELIELLRDDAILREIPRKASPRQKLTLARDMNEAAERFMRGE